MGKVIRLRVNPITEATDEQLKREWCPGCIYHYDDIHAELNGRGLGEYCAV